MRNELILDIKKFIDTYNFGDKVDQAHFEDLALKIFHYQRARDPILNKYWEGCDPKSIDEIKPFPTESLKYCKIGKGENYFESSSTTSSQASRHYYEDLELYEYQVKKYFPQVFPHFKITNLLDFRPHWSLHQMMQFLLVPQGEQVVLYGTSKNHYQQLAGEKPPQSPYLFDTGGFKNFLCPYTQEGLYVELKKFYQIENHHIIGEYGMTELMSQAYDVSFELNAQKRKKRCVPTLKVSSFNQGPQLMFIDLCNLDSCSFLLVGDLGQVLNDQEFTLEGRMSSLSTKGCSQQ